MYQSPVELVINNMYTQIASKQEGDVYRVVQSYGVNVNKEEMLKALKYDRDQYDEGYRNGVKEFVEYLKRHSCSYDLDNYHSFDAIDVDELNNLVDVFLYGV